MTFESEQVLAERYRLEERIALGGMGEVWCADVKPANISQPAPQLPHAVGEPLRTTGMAATTAPPTSSPTTTTSSTTTTRTTTATVSPQPQPAKGNGKGKGGTKK